MKLSNKEIGNYLIWVAVNLIVLLAFGTLKLGYSCFYPLDGFEHIEDYDISEFLAYTVVPFLVILAVKFKKSEI